MDAFRQPAPAAILSLPLRIAADGRLERTTSVEGLMRVFRAMAATSAAAWPHAPWFGLAEVFAAINPQLEDQQGIADALNRGLAGLGVGWARVAYVRSVRADAYGERSFRIALEVAGERVVHELMAV